MNYNVIHFTSADSKGKRVYMKIKRMTSVVTNTFYYKAALLPMAFLYVLPYTMGFAENLLKFFMVWGAGITAVTILKDKTVFKNKIYLALFVFFALSLVGVVANYNQNFVRNLLDWVYLVVFSFCLLYTAPNKKRELVYKEMTFFSSILIAISFCISLLSLLIFSFGVATSVEVNGQEYLIGTFENRLYGFMGNPNSTAMVSFLSILASLAVIAIKRVRKIKAAGKHDSRHIFLVINIILQVAVLYLSNSRSAMVALVVSVVVFVFFYGKAYWVQNIQKRSTRVLSLLLILFLAASSVIGAEQMVKKGISYLPPTISYIQRALKLENVNTMLNTNSSLKPVDTERNYGGQDTSNNRFEIWSAGLSSVSHHILTGVGNANVLESVKPYLSKKFLRRTPDMAANMHNIYVQVLVSGGMLPLLALLFFLGLSVHTGYKTLTKETANKKELMLKGLLLAACVGMMIENLFDSHLIGFMFFLVVPAFWSYLGYFLHLIQKRGEAKKEEALALEKDTVSHQ